MTSVVCFIDSKSIWLVVDRRLSSPGRPPDDTAKKLLTLQTLDGVAVLAYAGLGRTAKGTQPSDWMSAALRGYQLPLEQCLNVLAKAVKEELGAHLKTLPGVPAHNILVAGFTNHEEPRIYSIDVELSPDRKKQAFEYRRWAAGNPSNLPPRIVMAGSGAAYLSGDKTWQRRMLKVIAAHRKGRVTDQFVASQLAALNFEVHKTTPDGTVGPSCVVICRFPKSANRGSQHWYFTGTTRDRDTPMLPTIMNGMDVNAIINTTFPDFRATIANVERGGTFFDMDPDELNAKLALLPDTPDKQLR